MGLYIYQENSGGAYLIISEASTPPTNISVTEINGAPQSPAVDYTLLTSCANIENALYSTSADAQSVIDAMRQYVTDLGGGDMATGFAALSAAEQRIAAAYGIGTNPQRGATIPDVTLRMALDNRNIYINEQATKDRNLLLISLVSNVTTYSGALDYIIDSGNIDVIVY